MMTVRGPRGRPVVRGVADRHRRGAGRSDVRNGAGERLAERDIEVHGAAARGDLPGLAEGSAQSSDARAGTDVRPEHGGRPEDPGLGGRLVRARPANLGRTVRGDRDQRHSGMPRLEHGRMQIRDGGARGGDDRHGDARLEGEAECEEAGRALVDPHVHRERAEPIEPSGLEREGLRPGSRRQHEMAHAALDQPPEEHRCGVARAYRLRRLTPGRLRADGQGIRDGVGAVRHRGGRGRRRLRPPRRRRDPRAPARVAGGGPPPPR